MVLIGALIALPFGWMLFWLCSKLDDTRLKVVALAAFTHVASCIAFYFAFPAFRHIALGPYVGPGDDGRGFGTAFLMIGFLPSLVISNVLVAVASFLLNRSRATTQ